MRTTGLRATRSLRERPARLAVLALLTLALLAGFGRAGVGPSHAARSTAARPAGLWDGSADHGFRRWSQVQDGIHDAQFGQTKVSVVRSPVVRGHRAFRFSSTLQPAANGPRAELVDLSTLREGNAFWFGDVLYIPGRHRRWVGGHHTLMQFKNSGYGSPPVALDLRNLGRGPGKNGLFLVYVSGNRERYKLVVPSSRLYDRAISIEIGVRFSSDPQNGGLEVWASRRRAFGPIRAATLFPGQTSYFKQGQYGKAAGNVVYWHGAKRGATRASVRR